MTRRRFCVPRDSIRDGIAVLPPDQAHHLRHVLRMETGDAAEVFDGTGIGYIGEVEMRGPEVSIRNLQALPPLDSSFYLILASALIKPAKFEWMMQKATELGMDEIIPLQTRFTQIRIPPERIGDRLERWQRIVHEATRQCGRRISPRIRPPLEFADFLATEDLAQCTRILFYEKSLHPWRPESLTAGRIVLCVGPEGGWSEDEIEKAAQAGFQTLGLGQWILRAETAAIAAASIIQHQIHCTLRGQTT